MLHRFPPLNFGKYIPEKVIDEKPETHQPKHVRLHRKLQINRVNNHRSLR